MTSVPQPNPLRQPPPPLCPRCRPTRRLIPAQDGSRYVYTCLECAYVEVRA